MRKLRPFFVINYDFFADGEYRSPKESDGMAEDAAQMIARILRNISGPTSSSCKDATGISLWLEIAAHATAVAAIMQGSDVESTNLSRQVQWANEVILDRLLRPESRSKTPSQRAADVFNSRSRDPEPDLPF